MAQSDQKMGGGPYFSAKSLVAGERSLHKETGSFAYLQTAMIRYVNSKPRSPADI